MRLSLLYITTTALLLLTLSACRTRYIPIEQHHYHDSIRILSTTDSIYRIDSVLIYQAPDTLIIRERTILTNYSATSDTHRTQDSVPPLSTRQLNQIIQPPPRPHRNAVPYAIGCATPIILYLIYRLIINLIKHKKLWI
jgi:hypothetical protein